MTLTLTNVHPIDLTCTITSTSTLELFHGTVPLSSKGNSVFNELPTTGANEASEVTIADFTHNSAPHQIHVWEALVTGGVQKWTRESPGSRSGAYGTYGEVDILVVAVPQGISVPEPSSTNGPPAPGTTQSTVKVKIRPQGSLPY